MCEHDKSNLKLIIELVLNNEWNVAKTFWILNILKLDPKRRCFSTYGEEFDLFIKHVKELQRIDYQCLNPLCKCIYFTNDELYFEYDENNNLNFTLNQFIECSKCKNSNVKKVFQRTLS